MGTQTRSASERAVKPVRAKTRFENFQNGFENLETPIKRFFLISKRLQVKTRFQYFFLVLKQFFRFEII